MKLVLVEWVDSAFAQGWMSKDNAREHRESRIVTVGILLCENDERVTIMQSVSDKNDAGDRITIPRCSIKRMRTLKALDKLQGNEYNEGYGKEDENNGKQGNN